ncbi:MAG: FAD-dependent oxidoreductase [Collinsella sp.]|nr:FAD-dependent oxidoreductase [Collinsella sp.]
MANDWAMSEVDVLVIGAGVIGCTVARELTRFDLDVLVIESGSDIACGSTRANSGIVHAGFDPIPGTDKARYNVEGSRLFPKWAAELGFQYRVNGSMVIATADDEVAVLEELLGRGEANGVEGIRIVGGREARVLEPSLSKDVRAALVAPSGAICDPYDVALRSLENAVSNGARVMFETRAADVAHIGDRWVVDTAAGGISCRAIVNAAGIYSDEINNRAGLPHLQIEPVRGEYVLYDTDRGSLFSHTIFQTPTSTGKGVLVSPTVHGNLFVGPNARRQESRCEVPTTREGLEEILTKARRTWPSASRAGAIACFSGLRSRGDTGDFVVGPAEGHPGFYNAACIDSPGLSSAPAIATHLSALVADYLQAVPNPGFDPYNDVPRPFSEMDESERAEAIADDPGMGRIVCRCCEVTESEVVRALNGPVPCLTLDAVKWRCRATMGRCNGGFCTPLVLKIMCRELGVSPELLEKRSKGSQVVARARRDYLDLARSLDGERMDSRESSPSSEGGGQGRRAPHQSDGDRRASYDVVVVGGGAAGLAAARSAASQGASVLLLDRQSGFGGILRQCIHSGFGIKRYGEELVGPEYAALAMRDMEGVDTMNDATVLEVHEGVDRHRVVLASASGLRVVDAKAIVLATGSRERGFGALGIPGERPSGVFTAGSAQYLMNMQGCLPGRRAVILGSGDIGLIMARRMRMAGMEVVGVFEIAASPSGLRRNVVQCLDDFGIPLTLSATVTRVEGSGRLEAVWVSDVDRDSWAPIPGTERRIECDTLVLSVGLLPENEVAISLGVEIDPVTKGPVVDDSLQTSVPGVFSCGNSLHIHDLADNASQEGDVAGLGAARYASRGMGDADEDASIPVAPSGGVRYVVPHRIRLNGPDGDGLSLSFRVTHEMNRPRFVVEAMRGDGSTEVVATRRAMLAIPAEMSQIPIDRKKIGDAVRLTVSVEGEAR